MTWNVGGLPTDRMTEMVQLLPALGLGKVEVLALQEVSCPPGIMEVEVGRGNDRWHIVAGKRSTEWRGRMIAVRASFGKVMHKETAEDALGVVVNTAHHKIGVLNAHLPPKATLAETGARTAIWKSTRAMKQQSKIVMGDLNETFLQAEVAREEWSVLQRKTARGAMLLQWLNEQDMQAPAQDFPTPTYHPYNQLHQPRRLDYVFTSGIEEGGRGGVHHLRHLASSDHDAVATSLVVRTTGPPLQRGPPEQKHGARQLRGEELVSHAVKQSRSWKGDRVRDLQRVALAITERKQNPFRYVESREIKQLRAEAMRKKRTPEARTLWKEVWKRKKNSTGTSGTGTSSKKSSGTIGTRYMQ